MNGPEQFSEEDLHSLLREMAEEGPRPEALERARESLRAFEASAAGAATGASGESAATAGSSSASPLLAKGVLLVAVVGGVGAGSFWLLRSASGPSSVEAPTASLAPTVKEEAPAIAVRQESAARSVELAPESEAGTSSPPPPVEPQTQPAGPQPSEGTQRDLKRAKSRPSREHRAKPANRPTAEELAEAVRTASGEEDWRSVLRYSKDYLRWYGGERDAASMRGHQTLALAKLGRLGAARRSLLRLRSDHSDWFLLESLEADLERLGVDVGGGP